jgi:hypothetical protein
MDTKNRLADGPQIILLLLTIFITSLFVCACNEKAKKFPLGGEFIESQTDIYLIDTLSVSLSTIILDTVHTSGTGSLLIGNYRDDICGKISSRSYFQVGIPEDYDVNEGDLFDSLKLVIRYNKYFFGDTTRSQKISVHRLTENIESDDNHIITSVTFFNYDPLPIGSIFYTPTPNIETDTLFIKISDDIGLDLFEKLKDDSEILSNNESFINYFHGLALVADDAYDGAIIGFLANKEEDLKLILYTSRKDLTVRKINYEFKLVDPTKAFNHISHDFTSTQLNTLVEQKTKLSSLQTGGLSFLQGGIGLAIRVDFPSLNELLLLDRGKILKAQLSISPLKNSYNDRDLPYKLIMYELGKRNGTLGMQDEVSSSTPTIDRLYNEETAYLFDITTYLINKLADSYADPDKNLLITLPSNYQQSTFCRLIVDAQNKNTKLKIYYLNY